ncbi:hypothetical protein NPIL_663701 [Nephila pilipes]|uniref:Uncharacterized protein n=1 Tax=Nephila pilipes TaxID=299642 RepID=A0A8X6QZC9_NEPPI|nr:hypothetical protein NPIL_663701 [Nephila pilipes]
MACIGSPYSILPLDVWFVVTPGPNGHAPTELIGLQGVLRGGGNSPSPLDPVSFCYVLAAISPPPFALKKQGYLPFSLVIQLEFFLF